MQRRVKVVFLMVIEPANRGVMRIFAERFRKK